MKDKKFLWIIMLALCAILGLVSLWRVHDSSPSGIGQDDSSVEIINATKSDATSERQSMQDFIAGGSKEEDTEAITIELHSFDELINGDKTSPQASTEERQPGTVSTEEDVRESFQESAPVGPSYTFRNEKYLNQHFAKHGAEFSYANAQEYEQGASAVINNPNSLHKEEADDGDYVYYLESTNEFVVLSTDGYIRTYFKPSGGIDYYNRQ